MTKDKLSIFLSLVLRHKPDAAGIEVDKYGWANVQELIEGVNNTGRKMTMEDLEQIVVTDNKQRYSFNEDKTKIRANQCHSISVDVELEERRPPDVLYHGTATRFVESIKEEGIKPMSRQYVHLSTDMDTAAKVGKRHGAPFVFVIDSKEMYHDGIKFFVSKNGVWLTEYVDVRYLR